MNYMVAEKSKKYSLNYHLAQGVSVGVGGVSEADVEKISKALEDPNKVIRVSGKTTTTVQLIPTRNVLAVEIDELE